MLTTSTVAHIVVIAKHLCKISRVLNLLHCHLLQSTFSLPKAKARVVEMCINVNLVVVVPRPHHVLVVATVAVVARVQVLFLPAIEARVPSL